MVSKLLRMSKECPSFFSKIASSSSVKDRFELSKKLEYFRPPFAFLSRFALRSLEMQSLLMRRLQ
jgi:hypothetical protein